MSSIAFKPDDLISGRTARKLEDKATKLLPMWKCSRCNHIEQGGPTRVNVIGVRLADGSLSKKPFYSEPRHCSRCGGNMIKYNVKKGRVRK